MAAAQYAGVLRPQITILSADRARVEWVDPATREVVWTEECSPRAGCAFVSQIECKGEFRPLPGYFVDADGKRHFVLAAEPGRLGAKMGEVGVKT